MTNALGNTRNTHNSFAVYEFNLRKSQRAQIGQFSVEKVAQPVARHISARLATLSSSTVRKIVHRSSRRKNGIHNFVWLHEDSVIHRESLLEASFLYQVAVCPLVHSIYSQPVEVIYSDLDRPECPQRYTPDFLVVHASGFSTFIEVKHSALLKRTDHDFELIESGFHALGFGFLLLTERDLSDDLRLETAQLIKRYSVCVGPRADLPSVFDRQKSVTLDQLSNQLNLRSTEAIGLIPWGRLWFDPREPITGSLNLALHHSVSLNEHIHLKNWFDDPLR